MKHILTKGWLHLTLASGYRWSQIVTVHKCIEEIEIQGEKNMDDSSKVYYLEETDAYFLPVQME